MGRILCIDYGLKRVGLALSDELKIISSPFRVIKNNKMLIENLMKIIKEYNIEKVIIGYPYSDIYKESINYVEEFANRLKKYLNIPIEFQNEEFSSEYANSFLKSLGLKPKEIRQKIDQFAAQKILYDYLYKLNKN